MVHRPGVSAQPDPGPQEDALPPLLAQPGHPVALSARPASDVSPQVRPLAAASLLATFDRMDYFLGGGLMEEEMYETFNFLGAARTDEHVRDSRRISLAAVNNNPMRSTVQLIPGALMVNSDYVLAIMSVSRSRSVFV